MKTTILLNGFRRGLWHRKLMHSRPRWLLLDWRYRHDGGVYFITLFGDIGSDDALCVPFVYWAAFLLTLVLRAETGASKSALEWILLHFECVCVAVVVLFCSPFASLTVSLHVLCSTSLTHHSILMSVSLSLLSPLLSRSFQFFYRSWGGIHFQSFPHSTCCRPCPPNCFFPGRWQPVLLDT